MLNSTLWHRLVMFQFHYQIWMFRMNVSFELFLERMFNFAIRRTNSKFNRIFVACTDADVYQCLLSRRSAVCCVDDVFRFRFRFCLTSEEVQKVTFCRTLCLEFIHHTSREIYPNTKKRKKSTTTHHKNKKTISPCSFLIDFLQLHYASHSHARGQNHNS